MAILEENWKSIKNRVILPLWNGKFKKMYEKVKMDYDDFESLAGIELTKAFKSYDPEKSNLYTYSTRVIDRKALTELRNCTQRDKRKALHVSESIDKPSKENTKATIAECIPQENSTQEISELSELRVGNFLKALDNNQLRILVLAMLDFDNVDMAQTLNIPTKAVAGIMKSIKDSNLTRILYRRKF